MSEAIGKRAVDCKHWRWMPGMRRLHPKLGASRALVVGPQGCHVAKEQRLAAGFRVEDDGCLPDLADPATLGCLLVLVRDAHKDACITIGFDGDDWVVCSRWCDYCEVSRGLSEAEALVSALEAAE